MLIRKKSGNLLNDPRTSRETRSDEKKVRKRRPVCLYDQLLVLNSWSVGSMSSSYGNIIEALLEMWAAIR